ncbi:putative sucrase ferredoxin domain-containing protein [Daldinia childiae]|uniref:putative sucrase ferredoxin domain-containing protein n=1 Tax=Daldinia childiae TaxID=326645 RepID=UPI001447CE5B|nr:putative sucrase ferredoxin domain-containing protein [Daldinia childiae]KAF3061732.1 putative sucrase ferredoxin domain-containing protein [Daldinia childiae]
MAAGLLSLIGGARRALTGSARASELFPQTRPDVDGEACKHDCDSCTVKYPRHFKVEESHPLYGNIKPWSTHVIVATSKSDWKRDVEDERGSVMEAFGHASKPGNGRLMLSASNMPTSTHQADYSQPTSILVLPAFTIIDNVTPPAVPSLVNKYISRAPTTSDPLDPLSLPKTIPSSRSASATCTRARAPTAPSFSCARTARAMPVARDLDDERPGGVGIYFVNHVGGHKYSANVLIYRRPDAFGLDKVDRGKLPPGQEPQVKAVKPAPAEDGEDAGEPDVGAGQCIWLARVRPEDCENLVRYTILQGKVVKPDKQLRGGFDRSTGMISW